MIFVTVGTQKFPFDRLIKEIDILAKRKQIKEDVFAQIGYCKYSPSSISYKEFLTSEEFENALDEATVVITHGGTSSIIKAIKKGKKVIAIPRLSKFNEHVDNHQIEITSLLHNEGHIREIREVNSLEKELANIKQWTPSPFISSNERILNLIKDFIDKT